MASLINKTAHRNDKRLLCTSKINIQPSYFCRYGTKCHFAHDIYEQSIDPDRLKAYQIIIGKDLTTLPQRSGIIMDAVYKHLLLFTDLCSQCQKNKCSGGFNCRDGAFDECFKVCQNDLLLGECLNPISVIMIPSTYLSKIKGQDKIPEMVYHGCLNGHHLTQRSRPASYENLQLEQNYDFLIPYDTYFSLRQLRFQKQYETAFRKKSTEPEIPMIGEESSEDSVDKELEQILDN